MTERQACCTLPPPLFLFLFSPPSLVIDCPPMPIVHVCVHTACTHILSYVLLFFFSSCPFLLAQQSVFFSPGPQHSSPLLPAAGEQTLT